MAQNLQKPLVALFWGTLASDNDAIEESCFDRFLEKFSYSNQLTNFRHFGSWSELHFFNSLELPGAVLRYPANISEISIFQSDPMELLKLPSSFSYINVATILSRISKAENVFIPKILIIPTNLFFGFNRLQFPVTLIFAMSINKVQWQDH